MDCFLVGINTENLNNISCYIDSLEHAEDTRILIVDKLDKRNNSSIKEALLSNGIKNILAYPHQRVYYLDNGCTVQQIYVDLIDYHGWIPMYDIILFDDDVSEECIHTYSSFIIDSCVDDFDPVKYDFKEICCDDLFGILGV